MRIRRWLVVIGALLVAALALYVLLDAQAPPSSKETVGPSPRVLDEIDAKSRKAMRDLLRDSEGK